MGTRHEELEPLGNAAGSLASCIKGLGRPAEER